MKNFYDFIDGEVLFEIGLEDNSYMNEVILICLDKFIVS